MSTIPSLALLPSGYKASKVYSVLPSDGTGDFDFTRSGSATRVNSQGLIELVDSNVPRLNYPMIDGVVSGCPSLLLEPTRSNDLQRSQEFDNAYWTKYQTSVSANSSISPDGTLNADKLIEDNSNSTHQLGRAIGYNSGTTYTVSLFAKSSNRNLEIAAGNTGTFPVKAIFDLSNGTVLSSTLGNSSIENYGNGWYRCIITATALATATTNINFGLTNGSTLSYSGDGVSFIELFGVMREQGSYATSYIPTNGSTVTRVAESSVQTPPDGIIGQTEGTIYVEYPNIDNLFAFIGLSLGGSNNNRMIIYSSGDNILYAQFRQGGSITLSGGSSVINGKAKAALSFSSTESVFYVNGIQVAVGTATIWSGLTQVNLNQANQIGAKVKDLRVYNTRLSDAQLQALTT